MHRPRHEPAMTARTAAPRTVFLGFTTAGVAAVLVLAALWRPMVWTWQIAAIMVLNLLPFAITVAVLPAVMRAAAANRADSRRAAVRLIAVVTTVQVLLIGLVIPVAAQRMQRPIRSVGEGVPLSLHTSAQLVRSWSRWPGARGSVARELGRRATLAVTPALLAVAGWHLGALFGAGWLLTIAAWCALAPFVLVTGISLGNRSWMLLLLCLPLLALALASLSHQAAGRPLPSRHAT